MFEDCKRIPTVCVVSLRCAAGLQKEIDSLCAGFARNGWRTQQVLSEGYRAYRKADTEIDFVRISGGYIGMLKDALCEARSHRLRARLMALAPDLVIFYNQSPLNLQVLKLRRILPRCRFAVFLHDPWKPEKWRYGLRYALTYSAVEMLQRITVQQLDWVVTLSDYGTSLFRTHYPRFGGKHLQARILLPAKDESGSGGRIVHSIIGRINASTGHGHFCTLATAVKALRPDLQFEIITSSAAATASEFKRRAQEAGVKLSYRPVLIEDDIEAAIARSRCVFRLDDELTQSGVIPLCYRSGTPVITNDVPGLRQHVNPGRTGYVLDAVRSVPDIIRCLEHFQRDESVFAKECRSEFWREWEAKNFERYYATLLSA